MSSKSSVSLLGKRLAGVLPAMANVDMTDVMPLADVDMTDLMPLLHRLVRASEGIREELVKVEEAIRDTSPGGQ